MSQSNILHFGRQNQEVVQVTVILIQMERLIVCSVSSHPHQHSIIKLFDLCQSNRYKMLPHYSYNFHSLMSIFLYAYKPFYFLLSKILSHVFFQNFYSLHSLFFDPYGIYFGGSSSYPFVPQNLKRICKFYYITCKASIE